MNQQADTIASRALRVRRAIDEAARAAGRDPGSVTLVAVSKRHPVEAIEQAFDVGLSIFGENKVQEAEEKIPRFRKARWHLVGHLQRNKARRAVELFELIHSVDSIRLARTLDRLGLERGARVPVLLEVNAAGEPNKHGFAWSELDDAFAELRGCEGLALRGLMTMPPPFDDPEDARPYFRRLRESLERLSGSAPAGMALDQLSMGMTDDFRVAIEEGATFVRIGTAIFGPRE